MMIVRVPLTGNRRPSVYVLQIDKQPILAFEAVSLLEARELANEQWLLKDLRTIRSGGRPIWDGKSVISIGAAIGDDVAEVKEKLQQVKGTEDDLQLVYLIKLDR